MCVAQQFAQRSIRAIVVELEHEIALPRRAA
jgi:hypothetical protein